MTNECTKFIFDWSSAPHPGTGGAHVALSDTLVEWGKIPLNPLPILHPLNAYGVELSAPLPPRPNPPHPRNTVPL